jgi:hypothetical protein
MTLAMYATLKVTLGCFYRTAPRFFLRKSRPVLTVGEFSKTELTSYYGIDRQRILVVPNAAGGRVQAGNRIAPCSGSRAMLLAVSSPSYHKNLARLVEPLTRHLYPARRG